MTHYRNVAVLMFAVALMQVAIGSLGVVLPLAMAAENWSGLAIGFVAALYAAGFLIGAFFAPGFIARVGHIRAFTAAAGLAAASTLMLGLGTDIIAWGLSRMVFGACSALLFAVAESWIADATPAHQRGSVISAYQIAGRAGIVIGPFLVAMAVDLPQAFIICGIFAALALVPVSATHRDQPRPPGTFPAAPWSLLKAAPAAAISVFFAGFINTGVLTFLPIWAENLGPDTATNGFGAAALVMGVIYIASMGLQWPVGRLSDSVDRRMVIAGLGAGSALAALILTVLVNPGLIAGMALIGLWGAMAMSHYGIAVAHAADRVASTDLPAMTSGLLMAWGAGSIVGPLIAGGLYATPIGMRGVFLFAALGGVALAGLMFLRNRNRAAPDPVDREPFVNVQATSAALTEAHTDDTDFEPSWEPDDMKM